MPRSERRGPFVALMAALIALSWAALWAWGHSPYGRFLSHHGLEGAGADPALMPVFVAGWVVMVVAMMLPTSLPLITLFRTLVRGREDHARLVVLLVSGYLGAWTLFGVVVYSGDWALHRVVEGSAWFETNARFVAAGTLVLAGLYQFTPLKRRCLRKCRSPLGFVAGHWRGHDDAAQALKLGAHHGLFCVGCCWSLMLVMFALGAGSLGWMLVLGAVMAVEKNASWGRTIGAPLGLVLLASGLALGTTVLAAQPTHLH